MGEFYSDTMKRERNKSAVVPEQVKGKWADVLMPFPNSWLIASCKSI